MPGAQSSAESFSIFPSITFFDVLLWVGIAILIFLIIREFVTWYWKINRIVDLLERIEINTRKGVDSTEQDYSEREEYKAEDSETEKVSEKDNIDPRIYRIFIFVFAAIGFLGAVLYLRNPEPVVSLLVLTFVGFSGAVISGVALRVSSIK